MAHDIFISYSSKDSTVTNAVCAGLESARIRCWIAPRDIAPSADWAASIISAIDAARVMVLVFSTHANESKQIHREVQRAFEKEVPVIPFRIENAIPDGALAYYMGPVHWLDALTPSLQQHTSTLVKSVAALLEATSAVRNQSELNLQGVKLTQAPSFECSLLSIVIASVCPNCLSLDLKMRTC